MNPVEAYILEIEQPNKAMLQKLHSIILSCAPQIEAKLTYSIPFYYYYSRLCYLNLKENGIDLGFCHGALLSDHYLLGRKELKEVRIIRYKSLQEINEVELLPIIFEAIILNEMTNKKK